MNPMQQPKRIALKRSGLINCIHSAIGVFEGCAKDMRDVSAETKNPGFMRLAEQFDRQIAEARAMAEEIESRDSFIVED